jgi:hypothetical protein
MATLYAALSRPDPRLDDEIAPAIALVRTLHAFMGAACVMVALAASDADAVGGTALVSGAILLTSALLVPLRSAWVRWLAVGAGWLAMAVCAAAMLRYPVAPPLAMTLLMGLLWYATASIGGVPRAGVRMITPRLPEPTLDRYDGRIEDYIEGR